MLLLVMHPDNETYILLDVPDMHTEVEALFRVREHEIAQARAAADAALIEAVCEAESKARVHCWSSSITTMRRRRFVPRRVDMRRWAPSRIARNMAVRAKAAVTAAAGRWGAT